MNKKHHIKLEIATLLFLVCMTSVKIFAQTPDYPSFYTDNIASIPDLTQTDKRADFPGGGSQYCCLAAIANSLMWLDENGFPNLVENAKSQFDDEVRLVKLLGSRTYMNTRLDEGTGTTNIMRGLKKYIQDRGYEIDRLEYQGWRKHSPEMKTNYPVPQLDWLKQGILDQGAVWLNIGWYKHDLVKNQYERIAGHWVTLVGYGKDESNTLDPNILILHDPSPRAGHDFSNEYAVSKKISSGRLTGEWIGLPRSSAGYCQLGGGMHLKKEADTAIIDGAIALKLKPSTNEIKWSRSHTQESIKTSQEESGDEQVDEKLSNARTMLKGTNKNTDEARRILLDLAENHFSSLTPIQRCYVYVYLGYIEDLAENREAAVRWFKEAVELEAAQQDGIYRIAEYGVDKSIVWIRHLDEGTTISQDSQRKRTDQNNGLLQKIGNGFVLKDEPKNIGTPKMNLSGAERLENFDILAQAIDQNYSFFDHKNIDWQEITAKYREHVEAVDTGAKFYRLLYDFVRELKDAHSWLCNYKKVPQLDDFSPPLYTRFIEGKLVVTDVLKNSEAYAEGLRIGTVITGIDGMNVEEKIEKIRPLMRMCSSERHFLEQAYRQILCGKKGSAVTLRFTVSGSNTPKTVKLKRTLSKKEEIINPDFHVNKQKYIWDGLHPSGYGYIRIVSFSGREEIADEFDLALERLKNTPGLIIDIRENPGGFGTAQPRIIGRFITSRTKVNIAYAKNGPGHEDFSKHESYFEPTGPWQYTRPVALLINPITGSASDLFACRMISTGRPVTVGSGTHGNSTGTCLYVQLPCNLVVRISTGYICDVNGRITEVNGNAPDIHVEPTITDIVNGTDPVINAALKVLGNGQ